MVLTEVGPALISENFEKSTLFNSYRRITRKEIIFVVINIILMAETSSSLAAKKPRFESSDLNGSENEQKLRGVIRTLIAEKSRLEKPLQATKRLAKYCQYLKKENERLKQRAYNFEMGMARAERRSAQLKYDLQKAQNIQPSSPTAPKQAQFYLPSSIQSLVDSLTTQNVILMKNLNKATNFATTGASLMEENKRLEERVKALEDEIAIKESMVTEFRSILSESSENNDQELKRRIYEKQLECAELKTKLRNYYTYVRHLRERNTAIMNSVMGEFDQRTRLPVETNDDGFTDVSDEGATSSFSRCSTCSNSREGSQNPSRRMSLKDSDVQTDLELLVSSEKLMALHNSVDFQLQTFSGKEDEELPLKEANHQDCKKEIDDLKGQINEQTGIINAKLAKEESLERSLAELEAMLQEVSLENDNKEKNMRIVIDKLDALNKRNKQLEQQQLEAEQILQLMQDRVDTVNMNSQDSGKLEEELRECKKELEEKQLMQKVLEGYEEDIKAYSLERNELLKKHAELQKHFMEEKQKGEQLFNQLKSKANQSANESSETSYSRTQAQQRETHRRNPSFRQMREPYQCQQWGFSSPNQIVVADGGSRNIGMYSDFQPRYSKPDFHARDSMRHTSDETDNFGLTPEEVQEKRDYKDYIENGTLKCENCGERFPSALFQDHFRDCARDNSL